MPIEDIQAFIDLLKELGVDTYFLSTDDGINLHNNDSAKIIIDGDKIYNITYNKDWSKNSESVFDFWGGHALKISAMAAYGLTFKQGKELLAKLGYNVDSLSDDDPIKKFIVNVPRRRSIVPTIANMGPVTKEVFNEETGEMEVKNTIPKGSSGYVV